MTPTNKSASPPHIAYFSAFGAGDAWVVNELSQVHRASIPFKLNALRRPHQMFFRSAWMEELSAGAHYLYPVRPWDIVLSLVLAPFLFGTRFFAALFNALAGPREHFRARLASLAHFAVACAWARRVRGNPPAHIHSQWIHAGGTVAMYGAWLLGVSFSFTGHAADLYRERCALKDKIRRAEFIVCISEFHRQFYLKEGADPAKLFVVYCGIDPSAFTAREAERPLGNPPLIASSGRLVDKKGFDVLIDACALLRDRGESFRCCIGGSGPLEQALRDKIAGLGLNDVMEVTGEAICQEDLPDFMHRADVYCLACVWAADGDVDGLPQMLMEAMACGVPVVSTRLVGIPDLVIDGETGLLVDSESAEQLADALTRLLHDAELRAELSRGGLAHVLARFDINTCLEPLFLRFRNKVGQA